MNEKDMALAVIIFFSFTVEAASGFGSIVLAVTLGSLLFPIKTMVPLLAALNLFLGCYILTRYFRRVDWRLLTRRILPFMVMGTAVGAVLSTHLANQGLKIVFGALVVLFSLTQLYRIALLRLRPEKTTAQERPEWLTSLLMGLAGVTHGLYASGGPLLVYSLAGLNREKQVFRATLSAVWFVLNCILIIYFANVGQFTVQTARTILYFIPVIAVAIFLGEWLHHRINETHFKTFVYFLLVVAGSALFI